MKQIDLSCKIIAPALAGGLVATGDLRFTAAAVGVLNFLSIIVEYSCTEMIYKVTPRFASKNASVRQAQNGNYKSNNLTNSQHNQNGNGDHSNGEEGVISSGANNDDGWCCLMKILKQDGMLKTYFQQPIAAGGVALSLLYLNILTFGSIMTAYLVFRGVRMDVIGTLRGISCAIGLLGTVAFHFSAARISLEATGLWAIILQFICLSVSYYSLFVTDNYWSLFMLISGVCASRIGLWVFDISISQLMQEMVAEEVRGVVGGVQNSLNAMLGLLAYALGMLFPDPKEFHIYVVTGFSAVGVAMLLWFFGVYLKMRQK
uniref:Solute carrier family 40 member n=1 Tax=Leptocylindrus danicus TaxID=163516 RepID=A0A7S2K5D9_9STRA